MHLNLNAFVLGAALICSVPVSARDDRDDHEKHANRQERYEDRAHGDYHEWNANEDRAYRRYLQERRKKYHEFAKANRKDQQDYWNWRHSHPEYDRR